MSIPIYQVDAFTSQPYRGNPAAVCLLHEPKPDSWMLDVAREMNLSETAFILPQDDGFGLRWFTPAVEERLCGHATLASAHVLWETGRLNRAEKAYFHTLSGLLTATRKDQVIELDFPATPAYPVEPPDGLMDILGVTPLFTGKSQFDYLVEVEDENTVRHLNPDFNAMMKIETRGVIVTSRSNGEPFDFISRFFAPRDGIAEDPVTGSAHCCLGPFWAQKLGKTSFTAYQASSRGGVVQVRLEADRVILSGSALIVFEGILHY